MDPIEALIIEAYAQAEALFLPMRQWDAPCWSEVWSLRWDYPASGMPWRGGGEKEAQRTLEAAADAGLLLRSRGRTKTMSVALTRDGIRRAWQLLGEGPEPDMVVARHAAKLATPGCWVWEGLFSKDVQGMDDYKARFEDRHAEEARKTEWANLPALVAGVMVSNCAMNGYVAYRLTRAGIDALDKDDGPAPDGPAEAADGAVAVRDRAFDETLLWLNGLTRGTMGDAREIGEIGLTPGIIVYDRGGASVEKSYPQHTKA